MSKLDLTPAQENQLDELAVLIEGAAAKYGNRENRDDLRQEGRIGLIRAIKTFRPNRGATFKTYAARCIRNSCIDFVKKHRAHINAEDLTAANENTGERLTVSEAAEARAGRHEVERGLHGYDDDDLDYDEMAIRVRYIIQNTLTATERRAYELRSRGASFYELATNLEMPTTTAHRTFKSALLKLKKRLSENSLE